MEDDSFIVPDSEPIDYFDDDFYNMDSIETPRNNEDKKRTKKRKKDQPKQVNPARKNKRHKK